MAPELVKVKAKDLEKIRERLYSAEDKAKEYKQLLQEINDEVENFTSNFLSKDGNVNFGKIMSILTKMKFGGNMDKIKQELGIDGLFLIKENIDLALQDKK